MKASVRVLIIDDSAVVRQTMTEILSSDPDIEVIGTAADPLIAAERLKEEVPDVITLDVEMSRMDGITFLKKLMAQHPLPVVMCSSLTESGSETALKALEYGVVDIIQKPRVGTKAFLEESKVNICDAVKAAASARINIKQAYCGSLVIPKLTADAVIGKATSKAMIQTTDTIIAVGASTGGTEALRIFLEAMPHDAPGIVIVQHMPEKFTAAFATRMAGLCRISVKEAEDNDSVIRGRALIVLAIGICF
jgi:two-component system chemotaxis response regulator CheB